VFGGFEHGGNLEVQKKKKVKNFRDKAISEFSKNLQDSNKPQFFLKILSSRKKISLKKKLSVLSLNYPNVQQKAKSGHHVTRQIISEKFLGEVTSEKEHSCRVKRTTEFEQQA
jgi:hypothetical protein